MEEGDDEGGTSDGDGDEGGRATKRVMASKRATKTKRKKGTATWVGGDKEGNSEYPADDDDADDDDMPTDAEASRFTFLELLEHYMEQVQISEDNRKAVELAIMVEAGTTVREMDPMKKEVKENAFLNSYVSIIQEIPDERFEHVSIGTAMLLSYNYKGARKKVLEGGTLWRKYENELNEVRKFAFKFPGVGNLSRLPSRTAQLQQMKGPLIIKLWREKYPAESGVDFDDDYDVWAKIPEGWWLNHDVCKYILSCLVHKENKDITTKPTQQPSLLATRALRQGARKRRHWRLNVQSQKLIVLFQLKSMVTWTTSSKRLELRGYNPRS
jgi:hypothetical protein